VSAFRDRVAVIAYNGSAPTPLDVQTVAGYLVGWHSTVGYGVVNGAASAKPR